MNWERGSVRWTRAVAVAGFAALATGCVAGPTPSANVPAGSPQPVATSTQYAPQPMARADGGPMLWPLWEEDGSGDPDQGTQSLSHIGFLDASGKIVAPPKYRDFDVCVAEGRPTRLVAVRDGGIDVFALDGTVTSSIATTAFNVPDGWADRVRCEDNKTVAALTYRPDDASVDVWIDRRDVFDLLTGQRITSERTAARDDCAVTDDPPANLPEGYQNSLGGEWAANEDGSAMINVKTNAVVQLAEPRVTFCYGAGGFLSCSGGALPVVYDANGGLTAFSSVDVPSLPAGCGEIAVPYLWATAGNLQGYIDPTGKWHYQEPRYSYLSD